MEAKRMSKESSLEEIKDKLIYRDNGQVYWKKVILPKDVAWLIEQAEKIEKLQFQNTRLNKEIGKYAGRISDLSDELKTMAKHLFNV
jgi:hypothetical protein